MYLKEQEMLERSGFYILDTRIEEYANGLGLRDIGLDKDVGDLSGGQRTKVLLTKLLLENPMILILDEPTNFLDENHIAWLTNLLQNYENASLKRPMISSKKRFHTLRILSPATKRELPPPIWPRAVKRSWTRWISLSWARKR
jgi:energy-coupling factor transporter ATP-binding protein EcfA2